MAVCVCGLKLNTFIHSLHSLRLSLFSYPPPSSSSLSSASLSSSLRKNFWQYNANCCDDVTSVDLICNDTISSRQRSCSKREGAECRRGFASGAGGGGWRGELCRECSTTLCAVLDSFVIIWALNFLAHSLRPPPPRSPTLLCPWHQAPYPPLPLAFLSLPPRCRCCFLQPS